MITTEKARIELIEGNIVQITVKKGVSIEVEDGHEIIQGIVQEAGDSYHSNLIDISQMTFMSREARRLFGSQDKSNVAAIGIVMNSLLQRSFVNLYMKTTRPSLPTKAFDSVEQATIWLREQMA